MGDKADRKTLEETGWSPEMAPDFTTGREIGEPILQQVDRFRERELAVADDSHILAAATKGVEEGLQQLAKKRARA